MPADVITAPAINNSFLFMIGFSKKNTFFYVFYFVSISCPNLELSNEVSVVLNAVYSSNYSFDNLICFKIYALFSICVSYIQLL